MKRIFTIIALSVALSGCSATTEQEQELNDTTIESTEKSVSEQEIIETAEGLYPEYDSYEWVYTTEWDEEQPIKVVGTFVEADTEGDVVYCEMTLDSGELFYALIDKNDFDKVPIQVGNKAVLFGIAFGNNANNDDVEYDAMYASDYFPFNK